MAKKAIKLISLICVFVIVAGCFSIPIVIFATDNQDVIPNADVAEEVTRLDISGCSGQPRVESTYSENCSQYEGVCSDYLQLLAATNSSLLTLANTAITEQQVTSFFALLESLSTVITRQCLLAVMPFFCQYVYPPCDDDGSAQFITQQQCVNIRDDVCMQEWQLTSLTEFGPLLPDCSKQALSSSDNFNISLVVLTNRSNTLQCHYQFKELCGLCLPLCGTFSQYSNQVLLWQDIFTIVFDTLAVIGGITVFIAALIKRKKMFAFPQVLILYTVIGAVMLAMVTLINYIGGQERLLCSHELLHQALLEPTVYTQIAGFISHFSLPFITVTWFLHLFHFFIAIAFPFRFKLFGMSKWKNRLYISELVGSVVLCSLAPTVFVIVSDYTIGGFPPIYAVPSRSVAFYTVILPQCILLAVGLNLTIYSFVIIHKNAGLLKKGKNCWFINFRVPEVKIAIVLSYFLTFGILSLVNLTVAITERNSFLDNLFRYFACQLNGYNPECEEIRRDFERHSNPGLNAANNLFYAPVTWVYLLFAITTQDIKRFKLICHHLTVKPFTHASGVLFKRHLGKTSSEFSTKSSESHKSLHQ